MEARTPHEAYHKFDKAIKYRLELSPDQWVEPKFHINGQVSKIRCFDAETMENLDCGEINTTPCPWCKNGG